MAALRFSLAALTSPLKKKSEMKNWLKLSRPEFHTVAIFPLLLGASLGHAASGSFFLWPTLLALASVVAIMLATYWLGEVYDFEVDRLSATLEKNKFSGGTLVLQENDIPHRKVSMASLLAIVAALIIGLYLAWGAGYGTSLFLLGMAGAFMGIFYGTPPFQWAYKGVGEIMIAFSYGWFPVAAGYYLQSKSWDMEPIILFGLAPAISIFMVILINEFPDFPADRQFGKKNLVVRLGRERSAILYGITGIGLAAFIVALSLTGHKAFIYALPAALLSFWNAVDVLRGKWKDRNKLEEICGRTIALNLLISILLATGILLG